MDADFLGGSGGTSWISKHPIYLEADAEIKTAGNRFKAAACLQHVDNKNPNLHSGLSAVGKRGRSTSRTFLTIMHVAVAVAASAPETPSPQKTSGQLKHVNNYISIDTSIWMVNGWPPIFSANVWQGEMEGNKTHIQ